jgi:hypothetical protein
MLNPPAADSQRLSTFDIGEKDEELHIEGVERSQPIDETPSKTPSRVSGGISPSPAKSRLSSFSREQSQMSVGKVSTKSQPSLKIGSIKISKIKQQMKLNSNESQPSQPSAMSVKPPSEKVKKFERDYQLP